MRNSRYQTTYIDSYYSSDHYPSSSAHHQEYYTTNNDPYWTEDSTVPNYYQPRQRPVRKLSGGKHSQYYQNHPHHQYYHQQPYYEPTNHNRISHMEDHNMHDPSNYTYPEGEEELENNDSIEEEEITPDEVLAARNAELNKNLQSDIPPSSSSSSSSSALNNRNNNNENIDINNNNNGNDHNINLPLNQIQTNRDINNNEHNESSNQLQSNKKSKKRLISILQQFGKKIKLKSKKANQKKSIQTFLVNEPIGDILDYKQRQEIIELLSSPKPQIVSTSPLSANDNIINDTHNNNSNHNNNDNINNSDNNDNNNQSSSKLKPSKEATKVSNLKKIWVFRQVDSPNTNNTNNNNNTLPSTTVWTGFDYENQIKISKYYNDDNGIELFDTHIRQGKLPILVFPKRKICYYVTQIDGDVESLHVECLPNSNNVQFVYRYGQQSK